MATAYPPLIISCDNPEDDRSELLIRTAYELLDEGGLEGLTIRAVLGRTGLARRAFYDRFQGKDDLVLAIFGTALRTAAQQFRDTTARCDGPVEALRAIVTGIVVGQLGHDDMGENRRGPALSREHLRLAQMRPAELNSALEPLLDLIAGLVGDGMVQGLFREADPQLQARLIYNLVSTTVHTVLLAEEEEGGAIRALDRAGREELAAQVWEFCRRAIIA